MTISSQSVSAMASAVRGNPSSTAISPKIAPSEITLKTAPLPSADGVLIFTVPERSANMAEPVSPRSMIMVPRATDRGMA